MEGTEGKNWSRIHGKRLFTGLLLSNTSQNTCLGVGGTAHSGQGIRQEDALWTCLQAETSGDIFLKWGCSSQGILDCVESQKQNKKPNQETNLALISHNADNIV